MKKIIDFNKTVFELCKDDEDIINILASLGFTEILNPKMLNTVGRIMTIPKGARIKKINLDDIVKAFENNLYEIKK